MFFFLLALSISAVHSSGTFGDSVTEIRQSLGLDKSSPYMEFAPVDDSFSIPSTIDSNVLLSTFVNATVNGAIASVMVQQTYANPFDFVINARYVFPASTSAAVYAMQMVVEDRVIIADLREREVARKMYEDAVRAGKTASLLEQDRPNVFAMSVGNVLPGDRIDVQMFYTESLVPERGIYTFYYPSVVGPRFTGEGGAPLREPPIIQPTESGGDKVGPSWDIAMHVSSGTPLWTLTSSSHSVDASVAEGRLRLQPSEAYHTNKDFVATYSLADDAIVSGVIGYAPLVDNSLSIDFATSLRDENENVVIDFALEIESGEMRRKVVRAENDANFLLATVEPPRDVQQSAIAPREYVFVVDTSGSMTGFPLDTSLALLKSMLSELDASRDTFNVLQFAGGSAQFRSEGPVAATTENAKAALKFIEPAASRGGGTNIVNAFNELVKMKRSGVKGSARSVIVLTDGFVSVETAVFEIVQNNLDQGSWFAVSIGSSPNRYLTQGIAHVGRGREFVATSSVDADSVSQELMRVVRSPLLTNVRAEFLGINIVDGSQQPRRLPDLLGERPIQISAQWTGEIADDAAVVIHATKPDGEPYESRTPINAAVMKNPDAVALPLLWARDRIGDFDYTISNSDEKKAAILKVALQYGILTDYTSFVAIDYKVRTSEMSTDVDQAVKLSEGSFGEADDSAGSVNGGAFYSSPKVRTSSRPLSFDNAASSMSLLPALAFTLIAIALLGMDKK